MQDIKDGKAKKEDESRGIEEGEGGGEEKTTNGVF